MAQQPVHKIIYNDMGNSLIESLERHAGKPVILRARRGMGKSLVLDRIAKNQGRQVAKVNLFKSAKGRQFFGGYHPQPDGTLAWSDQAWTELCRPNPDCSYPSQACVCTKSMLIIDEINRGNEDIQARLLSMTEDGRPYIVLFEKGNDAFPLHPNVWVTGTMNPVGGGYSTSPLDSALEDRFRFYNVDKPITDEVAVLDGILLNSKWGTTAEQLMNMATDLRQKEETYMSTRALTMTAKSVLYGENIVDAIKLNFVNMLDPTSWSIVDAVIRTHFDAEWSKQGGIANLSF